jgi:hypothetical protein
MQIDKSFSRRSVWIILLFMFILFGACAGTFYSTLNTLSATAGQADGGTQTAGEGQLAVLVKQKTADFTAIVLPVMGAGFLAAGTLLWLVLRAMSGGSAAVPQRKPAARPAVAGDTGADVSPAGGQDRNLEQRLFVHLISILQREGRLVDFFSEDLDTYEDAQIGAAVRSIHENCKAGLEKYLRLEPVVSNPEGQTITLKPGFDAVAIKVVGNVAGDPPFTGVVRHRGWRAVGIDIPTLTNIRDAGLIAPAEIEVL